MRIAIIILTFTACISGCSQLAFNEEDDLRTVPVTNNPNIIPQKEARGMSEGVPY